MIPHGGAIADVARREDAQLIAAAPALLATVKEMLSYMDAALWRRASRPDLIDRMSAVVAAAESSATHVRAGDRTLCGRTLDDPTVVALDPKDGSYAKCFECWKLRRTP